MRFIVATIAFVSSSVLVAHSVQAQFHLPPIPRPPINFPPIPSPIPPQHPPEIHPLPTPPWWPGGRPEIPGVPGFDPSVDGNPYARVSIHNRTNNVVHVAVAFYRSEMHRRDFSGIPTLPNGLPDWNAAYQLLGWYDIAPGNVVYIGNNWGPDFFYAAYDDFGRNWVYDGVPNRDFQWNGNTIKMRECDIGDKYRGTNHTLNLD